MTSDFGPISDEARRAIERDLADLRAERDQVEATLRDPGEPGDPADQADRVQRGIRIQMLDERIDDLTERLRHGSAAGTPSTDTIGIGSTLTVRFGDGTTQTLQMGEVAEGYDASLVLADSPLGRALLGRRAGDAVAYDAPSGPTSATVVSVGVRPDEPTGQTGPSGSSRSSGSAGQDDAGDSADRDRTSPI